MSSDPQNDNIDISDEERRAILHRRKNNKRIDRLREALNGVDPMVLIGLGALVLLIWAVVTVTQIRTTEALVLGTGKVPVDVQWGVFLQPLQLVSGTAPMEDVTAYCYAWVLECLTLIWAFALDHTKEELLKANKTLGAVFGTFAVLLIGLNGWADYSNSPGNDPLVQGLIAGAMGLFVTTGLPVGVALLKVGIDRLKTQQAQ